MKISLEGPPGSLGSRPPGWSFFSLGFLASDPDAVSTVCALWVCLPGVGVGDEAAVPRWGLLRKAVLLVPSPSLPCTPVSAHHRTMREDYGDKVKASHWSRSPPRPPRERFELGDSRKPGEARPAPAQKAAQCESFLGDVWHKFVRFV